MFTQLPNAGAAIVTITIDARPAQVQQGTTVAAAMLSNGLRHTRTTPISGAKRAPFCMMGVCYDCLMVIDGRPNQRACATYVQENMHIKTQQGAGPKINKVANG